MDREQRLADAKEQAIRRLERGEPGWAVAGWLFQEFGRHEMYCERSIVWDLLKLARSGLHTVDKKFIHGFK